MCYFSIYYECAHAAHFFMRAERWYGIILLKSDYQNSREQFGKSSFNNSQDRYQNSVHNNSEAKTDENTSFFEMNQDISVNFWY